MTGRLPQILQSQSTFSCEFVQIYSLFRHGFKHKLKLKKTEIENRRILFFRDVFRKIDFCIDLTATVFGRPIQKIRSFSICSSFISVPSLIFKKKQHYKGANPCLPSKDSLIYSPYLFKG